MTLDKAIARMRWWLAAQYGDATDREAVQLMIAEIQRPRVRAEAHAMTLAEARERCAWLATPHGDGRVTIDARDRFAIAKVLDALDAWVPITDDPATWPKNGRAVLFTVGEVRHVTEGFRCDTAEPERWYLTLLHQDRAPRPHAWMPLPKPWGWTP